MSAEPESDLAALAAADPAPGPRRRRRTWPQRLVLMTNLAVAIACVVVAGSIFFHQRDLDQRPPIVATVPTTIAETIPPPIIESLVEAGPDTDPAGTTAPPTTTG